MKRRALGTRQRTRPDRITLTVSKATRLIGKRSNDAVERFTSRTPESQSAALGILACRELVACFIREAEMRSRDDVVGIRRKAHMTRGALLRRAQE